MRKFIVLAGVLLSAALMAQAQKSSRPKKIVEGSLRGNSGRKAAENLVPKTPLTHVPISGRIAGQAIEGSVAAQTADKGTAPQTTPALSTTPQLADEVKAAAQQAARARTDLESEVAAALAKRQALKQAQWEESFQTGIGKSVLFAPDGWDPDVGYSVTVFKINYNGKEEVFGIVPSHSLPQAGHFHDFTVGLDGKEFPIRLRHATGEEKEIAGTIIQVTPPSMLDITLVKLDPAALPYVQPLELADENASLQEVLFSYGYAAGTSTGVDRTVNAQSFISVRTNQTIEGDRYGFCGSPWLDANNKIKAIHTGSVVGVAGKEDVSFGTHVNFIRKLVDAYYHNGKSTYELVLGGHPLATLNVDEYIADVELLDKNNQVLFSHEFEGKFSQSIILNALKQFPQATYIKLTSRTAELVETKQQGTLLDEHRATPQQTQRQHWYNLQTRQILPGRPEEIKM